MMRHRELGIQGRDILRCERVALTAGDDVRYQETGLSVPSIRRLENYGGRRASNPSWLRQIESRGRSKFAGKEAWTSRTSILRPADNHRLSVSSTSKPQTAPDSSTSTDRLPVYTFTHYTYTLYSKLGRRAWTGRNRLDRPCE